VVQFRVRTKHPLQGTKEVVFDIAQQNIGNAMDMQNGIFTAPVAGIYFFNLTVSWEKHLGIVHLRKNGKSVEQLSSSRDTIKMPFLKLETGDKITVYLQSSYQDSGDYIHGFGPTFNEAYNNSGISPELFGALVHEIKS
jgi:C1q domain